MFPHSVQSVLVAAKDIDQHWNWDREDRKGIVAQKGPLLQCVSPSEAHCTLRKVLPLLLLTAALARLKYSFNFTGCLDMQNQKGTCLRILPCNDCLLVTIPEHHFTCSHLMSMWLQSSETVCSTCKKKRQKTHAEIQVIVQPASSN